jgi:hypothetical protein
MKSKIMEKLTKELAMNEVAQIRNIGSIEFDNEGAHAMEDSLHNWFISCIAFGMYDREEVIEVAKIVKSSSEINFQRWCS